MPRGRKPLAKNLPECPSCQSAPLKKKWYEVPDTLDDYDSDESISCVLCREEFDFYGLCTGCDQTVCEHCINVAIKENRNDAPEVVSPASKRRRNSDHYSLREADSTSTKKTSGKKRARDDSEEWVDAPSPKRRRSARRRSAESEDEGDASDEGSDGGTPEGLYEVEKILKHREIKPKPKKKRGRGRPPKTQYEFLIKWKKYPSSDNSWEPQSNLVGVDDLIKQYWKKHNKKQKAESVESSVKSSVDAEIDEIYADASDDELDIEMGDSGDESEIDVDSVKSGRELRRLLKKTLKEKNALAKENAGLRKKIEKLEKEMDGESDEE